MPRRKRSPGRWRVTARLLALRLRVQHHQVSIVIQPPKNLANLSEFLHLLRSQVVMLRKNLEKLSNFRLYQKEQIPWFGTGSRPVGGF